MTLKTRKRPMVRTKRVPIADIQCQNPIYETPDDGEFTIFVISLVDLFILQYFYRFSLGKWDIYTASKVRPRPGN